MDRLVAQDMTTLEPDPPVLCPDGSGGFLPQRPLPAPGTPDTYVPCINISASQIAVNPVTNKIYTYNSTSGFAVINGADHTFVTVPLALNGEVVSYIAVDPVTNKIFATARYYMAVIDGATNGVTVVPTGGASTDFPVGIAIDVMTNVVYVPYQSQRMLVFDATTMTPSTLSGLPTNLLGVAVDPIRNMVYVLDKYDPTSSGNGGVTPVSGAAGTATATGITTTSRLSPGTRARRRAARLR